MPNDLTPQPQTLVPGERAVCFCIIYPAGNMNAYQHALDFCRAAKIEFAGTEWAGVPIFAFPDNHRFQVVKLSDAEKPPDQLP